MDADTLLTLLKLLGGPALIAAIAAALMKLRKVERQRDAAQVRLTEQQAQHEKADTESTMVTAIKEVLEEVRAHSRSKDEELNTLRGEVRQQRNEHSAELREVRDQFRMFEHRVRVLLAAHGQWDIQVMAEVRKSNPDFPDPPPLDTFDENDA